MSTKVRAPLNAEYFANIADWVKGVLGVALQRFKAEEGWQGRNGGCFALGDGINGEPIFTTLIGNVTSQEKVEKYETLALEKMKRLAAHIGRDGHDSSYESRNPDNNEWGGAIMAERIMFSFSGLPEQGDEALMLVVAVLRDEIGFRKTEVIANKNKNPYFIPLLEGVREATHKEAMAAGADSFIEIK